jgi:16S rRNA (cytosine967-C5)-methyltransferase
MSLARLTAAKALLRCERGGYSQLVIDSAIRQAALTRRDAGFATALFYGVLERKITLDYCIDRYIKRSPNIKVRTVLRVAAFELLYLGGTEAYAAVDEAVESARALGAGFAAAMVNAVLRRFLRDGCAVGSVRGSAAERLSISCSCSIDVAERMIEWFGLQKADEILCGSFGGAPVYLRVNTLKISAPELVDILKLQGINARTADVLPHCLAAEGDCAHTQAFSDGLFHIQDISSQMAALLLAPRPGERILDVCAAPGSKSFVLAQEMENKGSILCADVSEGRLGLVGEGARRLGIGIIGLSKNDARIRRDDWGQFDAVLCDVPCSGLGALRRKPELRYRRAGEIDGFEKTGYDILSASAPRCRPGGRLVYSTCTLNPKENEQVVLKFLEEHREFSPCCFEDGRFYRTNLPGENGADGFFFSRIRRNI